MKLIRIKSSKQWLYPGLASSLLLVVLLTYQNCGAGGESGGTTSSTSSSVSVNPFAGDYFIATESFMPSTPDYYYEMNIGTDGSIILTQIAIPSDSGAAYYQTNIGTYSMSGNTMTVTYSYETCDRVGTETFNIAGDPENTVSLAGTTLDGAPIVYYFYSYDSYNVPSWYGNNVWSLIEDRSCTY